MNSSGSSLNCTRLRCSLISKPSVCQKIESPSRYITHQCWAHRGLCYMYLGDESSGMQDMVEAQRLKAIPEHNVIDDAIRDRGEEYTVFSIVSHFRLASLLVTRDLIWLDSPTSPSACCSDLPKPNFGMPKRRIIWGKQN